MEEYDGELWKKVDAFTKANDKHKHVACFTNPLTCYTCFKVRVCPERCARNLQLTRDVCIRSAWMNQLSKDARSTWTHKLTDAVSWHHVKRKGKSPRNRIQRLTWTCLYEWVETTKVPVDVEPSGNLLLHQRWRQDERQRHVVRFMRLSKRIEDCKPADVP
jgi:hypothetical protein